MKSMTGFGRGRCEVAGRRVVVEIRSVNHRFLEVKQRLPWAEVAVEQAIAQAIRKRLERGAVSVTVRDEGGGDVAPEVTVDIPLARSYAAALEQLRAACGLPGPVPVELVASQPGVLVVGGAVRDADALWSALAPGVEAALAELVATRAREGEALRSDLAARTRTLRQLADAVAQVNVEAPGEARRRLAERVSRLGTEIDPQRLAQEIAILADRADIAEELSRLRTHLDEVERLLAVETSAGRRLDFLAQEMLREVNTIGSKSPNADIARRVIEAKVEVERVREQVQNVE